MSLLVKLIKMIVSAAGLRTLLIIALLWLGLNVLCWVLGGIGLRSLGRKAGVFPLYTACYPAGQIYYTLRLNHKERLAKRAAWLIWWALVLVALGIACLIWAAVFYLQGNAAFWANLLTVVAVLALFFALLFYIGMRMLEFQALRRLIRNDLWLGISAFGTVFAIPLQRIFLYLLKNSE